MLQLSAGLLNASVMSLRTGDEIARVTQAIINPGNLKVEGFYCLDRYNKQELILLSQDIRDILPKGLVVNDFDVLVDAGELVRLKKVLSINYNPLGKQVVTVDKRKVGKVSDYAVETSSMYIQKLYVSQSIMRSLTNGSLSIDRSLVHEITPKRIVITELNSKAPATAPMAIPN